MNTRPTSATFSVERHDAVVAAAAIARRNAEYTAQIDAAANRVAALREQAASPAHVQSERLRILQSAEDRIATKRREHLFECARQDYYCAPQNFLVALEEELAHKEYHAMTSDDQTTLQDARNLRDELFLLGVESPRNQVRRTGNTMVTKKVRDTDTGMYTDRRLPLHILQSLHTLVQWGHTNSVNLGELVGRMQQEFDESQP